MPIFTTIENREFSENSNAFIKLEAVDPEGAPIIYSMENGPPGSTVNPTSGDFNWMTPEVNARQDYEGVVFGASDGVSKAIQTVTLSVIDGQVAMREIYVFDMSRSNFGPVGRQGGYPAVGATAKRAQSASGPDGILRIPASATTLYITDSSAFHDEPAVEISSLPSTKVTSIDNVRRPYIELIPHDLDAYTLIISVNGKGVTYQGMEPGTRYVTSDSANRSELNRTLREEMAARDRHVYFALGTSQSVNFDASPDPSNSIVVSIGTSGSFGGTGVISGGNITIVNPSSDAFEGNACHEYTQSHGPRGGVGPDCISTSSGATAAEITLLGSRIVNLGVRMRGKPINSTLSASIQMLNQMNAYLADRGFSVPGHTQSVSSRVAPRSLQENILPLSYIAEGSVSQSR